MSASEDIKDAIKGLAFNDASIRAILCTVTSVDTTKKTCVCEPVTTGADLLGVKLMAKNQTGFYIIPKVDSHVVVTVEADFSYVSMFSEVDEIQLNGDNYDGLVKIQELVDKLNNLEDAFNQHILLYNTHTHAGVTSGGSSTSPPAATDTNVLIPTVQTELENLTVKHGDGN